MTSKRRCLFLLSLTCACAPSASAPTPVAPSIASPAASVSAQATAPQKAIGSDLTDSADVSFRADFSQADLGGPWNVFGAQAPYREAHGGPDGLTLQISQAQKAWDAVGARTNRVKADGDFELRGRFRDLAGTGNTSAKLIVVDAASPRGEAAYVERLQLDGKVIFKFGGEVDGSLETWGMVPTSAKEGDLRLVRDTDTLHAFAREGDRGPWTEIGKGEKVPRSMPRIVKFGVKLSAASGLSAHVRWTEITMNGQLIRTE